MMLTKEVFNQLNNVSKLSVLPEETTEALVTERKAVFEAHKADPALMKTKTQEVNDKYLAMDVELVEATTEIDGETVTLIDAAKALVSQVRDVESLSNTKLVREAATVSIAVTLTNGIELDGDELSQNRLARALLVIEDDSTISWIALDNTVVQLNKDAIKEAIKLALEAQSVIFLKGKIE